MSVVPVRSGKKRGSPSVVSPVEDTGHGLTRSNLSRELFVAVVGPAGAGASTAAEFLQDAFRQRDVDGKRFKVHLVKASQIIKSKAGIGSDAAPGPVRKTSEDVKRLQDLGDELRSVDTTAIAKAMVGEIMTQRSVMTGLPEREIDGDPRVFVIDSLRHPDEVRLLRRLYGDAFALVGVVCAPAERKRRLIENRLYGKERKDEVKLAEIDAIMDRDADSDLPHGQHVTAVFELADFYVDNSSVMVEEVTGMNDDLERFVDIVAKTKVVRPTMDETAMHHAHSAQKRSACMSRQVGAALVDDQGNVVATGTNEVPRAGGGVYGEHFGFADDDRCVFKPDAKCMNNVEQNIIIENLIGALSNDLLPEIDRADLARRLRKTRIGGLIEFSRAVHAEMDAILSAARAGVSPKGKRLFVTTFPCHYCARHLVSSGVDEVQYIEPYPKSLAVELHADSIGSDRQRWKRPSEQRMVVEGERAARGDDKPSAAPEPPKALFHPFVGVAPRMYAKAFVKDRDLKDKTSGLFTGPGTSNWGETFQVSQVHYTVMEAKLTGRELVGS